MKFDPTKPVQTRSGLPARIVSDKAGGMFPILAIVTHPDGTERVLHHTLTGSTMGFPGMNLLDLVNAPETTEEFFNVYLSDHTIVGPKETIEHADADAAPDRSFTIRVLRESDKVVEVELANG